MDDDPGSLTPGGGETTYVEDRRRRRHRDRLVGFFVCIPIWVLSVVPLARDSIDGREGADVVAVYLVAGPSALESRP